MEKENCGQQSDGVSPTHRLVNNAGKQCMT